MTREQGTALTSASRLKIVGTAYGFNTAFPSGPSSSNMSVLSFTETNLAGPPLFSFFTHTCMLHNSGFFTESGSSKRINGRWTIC